MFLWWSSTKIVQAIWIRQKHGRQGAVLIFPIYLQLNLDNSKSKGPNSFVWIIEALNNWGLKCIHLFKSGLQNDF